MSETRLEDIETQLAFQEDLIQKLDTALISQQQQISDLQLVIQHLAKQVKEVEGQLPSAPEPPPPHY